MYALFMQTVCDVDITPFILLSFNSERLHPWKTLDLSMQCKVVKGRHSWFQQRLENLEYDQVLVMEKSWSVRN